MREDKHIPNKESTDGFNLDDIHPTDNAVITWPLKKDSIVPDDEIISEEVVDDVPTRLDEYGRPYTSFPATDRHGRPMTVECHTAPDGSHYTIENRVSADGVPHSVQYPGDWKGEAWQFDPSKIPEWKREEMGRGFLDLVLKYMQELEKDPVKKAEFEAGVAELKRKKGKK